MFSELAHRISTHPSGREPRCYPWTLCGAPSPRRCCLCSNKKRHWFTLGIFILLMLQVSACDPRKIICPLRILRGSRSTRIHALTKVSGRSTIARNPTGTAQPRSPDWVSATSRHVSRPPRRASAESSAFHEFIFHDCGRNGAG
jgi:hypothetical protein